MRRRVIAGVVQLAAFVGGGVISPAAHMAWHRPDHSHGPGGAAVAFDVAAPLPTAVRDTSRSPAAPEPGHQRPHTHTHAHPHPAEPVTPSVPALPGGSHHHRHHDRTPAHSQPAEPAPAENAASRPDPSSAPGATPIPPADPWHGHGSLAHLGLALLSAPPPLALPAPEPAGHLASTAHPRLVALHRPHFPLPRPPPVRVSS